MFDSPVLEVAIGLSYVFLILSLVATMLVEAVSDRLEWRGRMLYAHLCKLLGPSLAYEFYSDSKIVALASGGSTNPLTFEEQLAREAQEAQEQEEAREEHEARVVREGSESTSAIDNNLVPEKLRQKLRNWLAALWSKLSGAFGELPHQVDKLRSKLLGSTLGKKLLVIVPEVTTGEAEIIAQTIDAKRLPSYIPDAVFADVIVGWLRDEQTGRLLAPSSASKNERLLAVPPEIVKLWNEMYQSSVGEPAGMRRALVDWFKSSTDRMGGDYRRRVRYGLLWVGLFLAIFSNADAIHIAGKLYQDPQLRTQLVEAARQVQELCKDGQENCEDSEKRVQMSIQDSVHEGLRLSKEGLLGGNASFCKGGIWNCSWDWASSTSVALHIIGFLLTVLAIGLGTDFWFGAIQKLLSIGNAKKVALAQESDKNGDAPTSASGTAVQSPPMSVAGPLMLTDKAAIGMNGFAGRVFRESPLHAFWLGQLACLSYSDIGSLRDSALLRHLGLDPSPQLISKDSTQVYVFQHTDFAVVAFRGTEMVVDDFLADVEFKLEACGRNWNVTTQSVKVHEGFAKALDLVWKELMEALVACKTPIWFTGHSLGGALAVLAAYRFHHEPTGNATIHPEIGGIYTFGQPRVGNEHFKDDFPARLADRMYRYVNDTDIVPQVPPTRISSDQTYAHVGQLRYFDAIGQLHSHPDLWDRLVSTMDRILADVNWAKPGIWKEVAMHELRSPLANHAIAKYIQALERDPAVRAQWISNRT